MAVDPASRSATNSETKVHVLAVAIADTLTIFQAKIKRQEPTAATRPTKSAANSVERVNAARDPNAAFCMRSSRMMTLWFLLDQAA